MQEPSYGQGKSTRLLWTSAKDICQTSHERTWGPVVTCLAKPEPQSIASIMISDSVWKHLNISSLLRTTFNWRTPRASLRDPGQAYKEWDTPRSGAVWGYRHALGLPLTLQPGHFSFSFLEMPVMVPPVPAVATSMSIFPDWKWERKGSHDISRGWWIKNSQLSVDLI